MPIDRERLLAYPIADIEQRYTERDVILHALSVGCGAESAGERDLDFLYEKRLKVLPSLALVLCHRSIATMDLGIQYRKVVHATQSLQVHGPLPVQASVLCRTRIAEVWDLGADKGALLVIEKHLTDRDTGRDLATTRMGALCRADGGFGGPPPPLRPRAETPPAPEHVQDWRCPVAHAALYRLQGDLNPLHIDPALATAAGFPRPILHGLASFGAAQRAAIGGLLDDDPVRIRSVEGRFTAPFFPGETLRTRLWRTAGGIGFDCIAPERDATIIKDGRIEIRAST